MTKTPLKTKPGVLADSKRPLAGASYVNIAGLIDMVGPWADYGMNLGNVPNEIREQVQVVLEVIKVFRSYASVTYLEGDVTVTHSEMIVKDLDR